MEQGERRERRGQSRRRRERQHRTALTAAGGGALLVAVVLGLAALSRGEDKDSGQAPPGSELPRGGRSIFPEFRVVGFYGTPQDEELGVLGAGSPESIAGRLERQARPYAEGPGARPTLSAFELIAVVANASPGDDGKFRTRLEPATIRRYLAAARRARALLILDIQPGRADFPEEISRLEPFLAQPDVGLALDPEWHMGEDEVPGESIGSMTADELNQISARLSEVVRRGRLPEKLLVVHQFTKEMVEGRERLRRYPGVELVLNVDGFGDRTLKVAKYNEFVSDRSPARHGFKLFYREDTNLMGPRDVLSLRPQPEFVVYE
ncbi:MAG: hypothetical protein M3088_04380 [Actinomycetota bacterium]|nr:hypothetical protein [Actinomycetota bacterium]